MNVAEFSLCYVIIVWFFVGNPILMDDPGPTYILHLVGALLWILINVDSLWSSGGVDGLFMASSVWTVCSCDIGGRTRFDFKSYDGSFICPGVHWVQRISILCLIRKTRQPGMEVYTWIYCPCWVEPPTLASEVLCCYQCTNVTL